MSDFKRGDVMVLPRSCGVACTEIVTNAGTKPLAQVDPYLRYTTRWIPNQSSASKPFAKLDPDGHAMDYTPLYDAESSRKENIGRIAVFHNGLWSCRSENSLAPRDKR